MFQVCYKLESGELQPVDPNEYEETREAAERELVRVATENPELTLEIREAQ